jgi:hypothetical protein
LPYALSQKNKKQREVVRAVKTFGAGDKPKRRTQKRYRRPFHPMLTYFFMEGNMKIGVT